MSTDCSYLVEQAGFDYPPIGLYITPDPAAFEPLVRPAEGKWACVYMFFKRWLKGESVHLTASNFGCGGIGSYLFGVRQRSREEMIDFLYGSEGMKASAELMGQWIDASKSFQPEYEHVVIGPLKQGRDQYLKTVTFFVNPDQLSLMITGAYYHRGLPDQPVVSAPFSAGCGQLLPVFRDLDKPEAVISGTDIAMRKYLPQDILGFTVTRPLFEQLCELDQSSFLTKPFWKEVQKKRKKSEESKDDC